MRANPGREGDPLLLVRDRHDLRVAHVGARELLTGLTKTLLEWQFMRARGRRATCIARSGGGDVVCASSAANAGRARLGNGSLPYVSCRSHGLAASALAVVGQIGSVLHRP
jgi:hypothetical protein